MELSLAELGDFGAGKKGGAVAMVEEQPVATDEF